MAIVAMVIDHTAWGFVEFMTPLGQTMHILGRFTLPIMCFFIAEGYRHTKDIKKYLTRMATFALISGFPFYIFFHEEYGYRQNIIFDLFLALLALCISQYKKIEKPLRIVGVCLVIMVSAMIGGWVILPIFYVLIFYYAKDKKTRTVRFVLMTFVFEAVLICLIILNQHYHFSKYEWTVEERLYLLGFAMAAVPLYFYNGRKGKPLFKNRILDRYFFYAFYPAHFLVLYSIKCAISGVTVHDIYIHTNVLAFIVGLLIFVYVLRQPVSRAQIAVSFFMLSGVMYIYGFLLEVTALDVEGVYAATKLQYFAISLTMVAITFCLQELTHIKMPSFIYAAEGMMCIFILWVVFTYRQNRLMYSGIRINHSEGPFPRMEVVGYGPAFYIFVVYCGVVCMILTGVGIYSARHTNELQKKRLSVMLYAMLCMWIPYVVKMTGITNGYEIPALFIPITAAFLSLALVKYNCLDSVSLDVLNAVNKGKEGILIMDFGSKVLYFNTFMGDICDGLERYCDASRIPFVEEALRSRSGNVTFGERTFDVRVDPLIEQSHHVGSILWAFDITEKYSYFEKVKEDASRDPLTGVLNRNEFEKRVSKLIKNRRMGAFYMVDLDDFKNINDSYGHGVGDDILVAAAQAMEKSVPEGIKDSVTIGRMGGDEFFMFYEDEVDETQLGMFAQSVVDAFSSSLCDMGMGNATSLSIGIAICHGEENTEYDDAYRRADKALYKIKNRGKGRYAFSGR